MNNKNSGQKNRGVFDNINNKYREILDQIVEDNNECSAIIENSYNNRSDLQSKPRYSSVIRNDVRHELQSQLNSPSPGGINTNSIY